MVTQVQEMEIIVLCVYPTIHLCVDTLMIVVPDSVVYLVNRFIFKPA